MEMHKDLTAEQKAKGQGQWTDVCMTSLWLFREKWASVCWLAGGTEPEHVPNCCRTGEERRVSFAVHSVRPLPSAVYSLPSETHIHPAVR